MFRRLLYPRAIFVFSIMVILIACQLRYLQIQKMRTSQSNARRRVWISCCANCRHLCWLLADWSTKMVRFPSIPCYIRTNPFNFIKESKNQGYDKVALMAINANKVTLRHPQLDLHPIVRENSSRGSMQL